MNKCKIVLVLTLALAFIQWRQMKGQSIKVTNGASSVDISFTSSQDGTFYYALYTAKPISSPSAAAIKTPGTQNLTRSGSITINDAQINTHLTRTLHSLTDNATYYLYVVFESTQNGFGTATSYTLTLPKRQPDFNYVSQAKGTLNKTVQYLFYKPEAYLKDSTKRKFPLILFFHGIIPGTDVSAVRQSGLPQFIDGGNDVDFLVVSPRMNYNWPGSWYSPGSLDELFSLIKKTARVDTSKIYIAGLSGGGGGVYYFSAAHPDKIAAMFECSCVNVFWNADFPFPPVGPNYCMIKDIPFWAFHNSNDPTVTSNNTVAVVKGINACSPKPLIAPKLTLYNSNAHDAWTATDNNPAVFKWLLGYTKPHPLNQQPIITNDSILGVISSNRPIQIQAKANDPDKTGTLSYEWSLRKGGDLTLTGNFSNTLTISDFKSGSYVFRLLVTDGNGSRNFKDITLNISSNSLVTQTEEPVIEDTKPFIYPNPATNMIYFNVKAGDSVPYKIIGMSGAILLEGKSDSVSVESLPGGIYSVETPNGSYKMTKQ